MVLQNALVCLVLAICLIEPFVQNEACGDEQKLPIATPKQSEWVDRGNVLVAGHAGAWDVRLGGMISPATVIKKDGRYFLYYIGADGDRSTDGGPRHRALGVAVSPDGIRFEKYSNNPVLSFLPNQNEEEGIFSAGAALDAEGNIVLYYGGMNAGNKSSTQVTSDVRLAVSRDGVRFKDTGVVLAYRGEKVWGRGDELFPLGALRAHGTWHVYYTAKSGMRRRLIDSVLGRSPIYWSLGIASGERRGNLTNTKGIITRGSYVIGGGDPVWLGAGRIALFLVRDFKNTLIEVRTASSERPDVLSEPEQIYRFPDVSRSTVFLDNETGTWFMYYLNRSETTIRVKTALARSFVQRVKPLEATAIDAKQR